ncbi:MAG TPA: Rid family detoxifying hydrolase, partial [Anaerolineales bacterium]|nr:Rid family detoxifying hydrolase [Anaerolineales bacterium]
MSNPTKEVIKTERAPKAIGPYSVGIQTEQFVFTAGQAGIVPETGNIIEGGIENETRQTLTNIKNILEEAESSLSLVVKTTVFLRDMADFSRMNAVYAEFFPENPPARTTVQAAALPKNVAVEIEAI